MLGRLLQRALPMSGVGANETTGISVYDWAKMFSPGAQVTYNGNAYQAYQLTNPAGGAYVGTNPIVFAVAAIRTQLFSEARFQFQQLRNGKPGDLFGTSDLQILEEPWPGHTTRDLLTQVEMDVVTQGQSYWVKNDGYLLRLEGSKVYIVTESVYEAALTGNQVGERLSYYVYKPDNDARHWTTFLPEEVCHYMPYPNPQNRFIGQSWLSPCLPDIVTDEAITAHKQSTIQNGANLSTVISMSADVSPEEAQQFIEIFRRQHEGPQNSAKTLFVGGGSDVQTVGQTFENLMLQATQGSGEVRIAAAAGVPPTIVGFSEGLKGSTLNAGNYGEARRRLSDVTMRPLWGSFAGAMASLINVPSGARLWYDDRHIAFMREDQADAAQILDNTASALLKLIQMGFEPDAAVDAITAGDLSRLGGHHTGLYSVQLQPPGNGEMGTNEQLALPMNGDKPATNGKQPASV